MLTLGFLLACFRASYSHPQWGAQIVSLRQWPVRVQLLQEAFHSEPPGAHWRGHKIGIGRGVMKVR
jgi:hypothetical protein